MLSVFSGLSKVFVEVKNKNGTSDKRCACGTWMAHWENYAEEKALKCANMNCKNDAYDGAHVIKCDISDKAEYIVPLCRECNMQKDTKFHVIRDDLVKAVMPNCKN